MRSNLECAVVLRDAIHFHFEIYLFYFKGGFIRCFFCQNYSCLGSVGCTDFLFMEKSIARQGQDSFLKASSESHVLCSAGSVPGNSLSQ